MSTLRAIFKFFQLQRYHISAIFKDKRISLSNNSLVKLLYYFADSTLLKECYRQNKFLY